MKNQGHKMEYRFECTSCGKCCNTPPQFTLIESINLWQEFILYLPAVCVPVDDGIAISEASRIVRRQVDHLEGLGSSMIDYHGMRSEEHKSELQSLMRISYAVFCLKKTNCITSNSDEY